MAAQRQIVVGVDASPDSDAAVRWALRMATVAHQAVALLHSVPRSDLLEESQLFAAPAQGDAVLAHALEIAADVGSVVVTVHQTDEVGPVDALLRAAGTAAMVVVGAVGHSRLGGMLAGSVSQHVARHAACPVVVVREQADLAATRVVVGVDRSEPSAAALEFALHHAASCAAAVWVIQAFRAPTLHGAYGADLPLPDDTGVRMERHQVGLDNWLEPWRQKHPDVPVYTEAIPGNATRILADSSETAALVVVGARGRGAFADLLLGSVSQGVLHLAQCPVAVIR